MKTRKSDVHGFVALSIAIVMLALGSASPAAEGIWLERADMPTPRMLLSTCVVEGRIYAVGGSPTPHVEISVLEEYNPQTNIWTRKTAMPTPRGGLGVSAANGMIYAIGGLALGARTVEAYDPKTDTWTRKADMPTARGFLTTSVVNGKIYAVGGAMDTSGPAFMAVEEYDPATDTWTRKADLPEPRYLHAASVVDGKIYIIAGSWQAWTASRAVYAYDPATNTWEQRADAPTARSWLSAAEADGRIYVIGGDFGPPKANVEEYDPVTDTWRRLPDMPTPRGALSTAALDDKIYVMGGTITLFNDVLSTVEAYTPNPLVVDFNGDEVVDIEDLLRLIESWGQDDSEVDIAPRPFGDGMIDRNDLEILMSYWGQEIPSPALIARWRLDEADGAVASDCIGGHDGTVTGIPDWQPSGGHIGGAMRFDGVTVVTTDHVVNPTDGPFSVFAWVKGGGPGQVLLSQAGGANWLMLTPEGALMTELKQAGRTGRPLTSSAVITDDAWHRVAFVWDGSSRILYVDDVEVALDTQTSLPLCLGGLNIGAASTLAASTFWSGLIDDVRIYGRAVKR